MLTVPLVAEAGRVLVVDVAAAVAARIAVAEAVGAARPRVEGTAQVAVAAVAAQTTEVLVPAGRLPTAGAVEEVAQAVPEAAVAAAAARLLGGACGP